MNNLRTVATLLFSQARHHLPRLGLASLAVIAASCAVVWVVSGYDALVAEFDEHASTYMGRYDVIVVPGRAMGGTLPESLIDDFRADPAVAEVNPIIQSRVAVARSSPPSGGERIEPGTEVMGGSLPPVHGAPPLGPVLVGTSAKEPPHELIEGEWLSGPDSAVLTDREAKRLGVEVGGRVLVTSLTNQKTLALVGIVREPALSPAFGGPGDGRSAGGTPGGDRPAGRKGPRRGGRGRGRPATARGLGRPRPAPGGGPGQARGRGGPSQPARRFRHNTGVQRCTSAARLPMKSTVTSHRRTSYNWPSSTMPFGRLRPAMAGSPGQGRSRRKGPGSDRRRGGYGAGTEASRAERAASLFSHRNGPLFGRPCSSSSPRFRWVSASGPGNWPCSALSG